MATIDGNMLEKMALFHSAFPGKVWSENTLVCYDNEPYLYTSVPNQAKTLFFEMFGAFRWLLGTHPPTAQRESRLCIWSLGLKNPSGYRCFGVSIHTATHMGSEYTGTYMCVFGCVRRRS